MQSYTQQTLNNKKPNQQQKHINKPSWFHQRIGRKKYALMVIPLMAIWLLLASTIGYIGYVTEYPPSDISVLIPLLVIQMMVGFAILILANKRLHDCNWRGAWGLITFVPIILLFVKGTEGENRFGVRDYNIQTPTNNAKSDNSIWLAQFFVFIITVHAINDLQHHLQSNLSPTQAYPSTVFSDV